MTWSRLGCGHRHMFQSMQHKDNPCWISWSSEAFFKNRLVSPSPRVLKSDHKTSLRLHDKSHTRITKSNLLYIKADSLLYKK